MMAEKARLFGDMQLWQAIILSESPKETQILGRQVSGFSQKIWEEKRGSIVVEGNRHKFLQNSDLGQFLLSTGDAVLVEASPHDKIWGIGMKYSDKDIEDPTKWNGLNLLGFALMEVRDLMRITLMR